MLCPFSRWDKLRLRFSAYCLTASKLIELWFKLRPTQIQSMCFPHRSSLLVLSHVAHSYRNSHSLNLSLSLVFTSLPFLICFMPMSPYPSCVITAKWMEPHCASNIASHWALRKHTVQIVWLVDWLVEWNPVYSPEATQQENITSGQADWPAGSSIHVDGRPSKAA